MAEAMTGAVQDADARARRLVDAVAHKVGDFHARLDQVATTIAARLTAAEAAAREAGTRAQDAEAALSAAAARVTALHARLRSQTELLHAMRADALAAAAERDDVLHRAAADAAAQAQVMSDHAASVAALRRELNTVRREAARARQEGEQAATQRMQATVDAMQAERDSALAQLAQLAQLGHGAAPPPWGDDDDAPRGSAGHTRGDEGVMPFRGVGGDLSRDEAHHRRRAAQAAALHDQLRRRAQDLHARALAALGDDGERGGKEVDGRRPQLQPWVDVDDVTIGRRGHSQPPPVPVPDDSDA
jgi:hypothetical protein